MARRLIIAAGLLLLCPLAPLHAEPAAAVETDHKAACDRLADSVISERRMTGQVGTVTNAAVDAMFAQDTAMVEMETNYPGIRKTLTATLYPLLLRSMRETIPLYRAELSAFYQSNLTVSEVREAIAFFENPIAGRFFDSAAGNMTYTTVAKQLVAQQDASPSAMRTDIGNAATRTLRTITPEDRRFIGQFFQSPTGLKLVSLNPRKAPIDAKWLNYSPPGMEQEVEQAVMKAMIDHVAKTDPDTAAAMRKRLHAEINGQKADK